MKNLAVERTLYIYAKEYLAELVRTKEELKYKQEKYV
jgi:hypothetical protein